MLDNQAGSKAYLFLQFNQDKRQVDQMERYKILYQGGQGELVEKKSRFIATIRPVRSEEEAGTFVEEMKKKYCYAYVIGERGEKSRCSDDGEPAQTAGRPMLDVLLGEEIRDVCAVVTRYFGGVLLGTGGLVRAYSGAVREGLKQSMVVEKIPGKKLRVTTDYNGVGKLQYTAAQMGITVLDTEYTDQVVMTLLAPLEEAGKLLSQITERTAGKALIEDEGKLYYGVAGGEIILF